jgi:NAD(P)-dependent dehydrogenase (short-subunit alcohol dehydrogenase family)
MKPLEGKTALVTGAAKRIGRTIALALADAGATVAVTFLSSEEDASGTVLDFAERDAQGMALRCDVRDPLSVTEAVAAVVEEYGGLDLLVNNAGVFETAALEEISVGQWDAMFETNTRGPFLMAQAAHPYLKLARGRIVNVGSLGGMHAWATHGHYCTSKAALHMLTQVMAKAWAPEISVNCVAPGMIVNGETVDAGYEHFAAKTPMGRNGSAEEVAAAVLQFATGPHFVTGQILAVDGGLGL